MNKDDGIEFFGGNANAKHVVLTGIGDDGLDWTDGWQGKVQYLVAQQYPDSGDQGIEADNNGDNNTASPRSKPVISNVTLLGVPGGEGSDVGILLREGTAGNIYNAIVDGFNDGCIQIDGKETFENTWDGTGSNGELALTNSLINCDTNYIENEDAAFTAPFSVEDWFTKLNTDNQVADAMLVDPRPDDGIPNYAPGAGSPALGAGQAPTDSFFDQVDFIGGVGAEDWTAGWTTHARK